MFSRVVLGYVLALPILVTLVADTQYNIAVTMSSNTPGTLEIFYDPGAGFIGAVTTPLKPSERSERYKLRLPPGDYRYLRIDPGTAPGRYVIERVEILRPDGSAQTTIPLSEIVPANQLSTVGRTASRLEVESTGTDPQMLYAPKPPLAIKAASPMQGWLVGTFAAVWAGAVACVWVLERLFRRAIPAAQRAITYISSGARANPRRAVLIAACVSTIAATYPVIFLGRSFVAPNNGPSPMLYDQPPFAPGSDTEVEDVRGSDTAAAMYAFVPYSHIQREALASGEMPLWNRYNAAGRPLWGQGQTLLLDPLHWFTLVVPDPSLGWDFKFIAHRFVFAAGVGMAALAATSAWLPAAIVTFAAPFIGFYAYRLNHSAAFTVTYAPWVLLACFLLARAADARARARAAILLAVTAALVFLASPPKEGIVMLFGLGIAGATTLLISKGDVRDRARRLGAAVLAASGTILVTAPQWLMFRDTLKQSLLPAQVESSHIWTAGAPHTVALFLSPLTPGPVLPGLHPLGLLLLLAAVSAPVRIFRQPAVLASAGTAVALLVVAYGFVPGWLLRATFVTQIGHLYDVFITAALVPLLVVCAAGAVVLVEAAFWRGTVVTVFASLAGWWLVTRVEGLASPSGFEPMVSLLVLALAAALPWCFVQARLGRGPLLSLAASGAAIAVLLLPGGLHPTSGVPFLDRLLVQARLRPPSDAHSGAVDTVRGLTVEPGRTAGVEWSLVAGTQALYGLEGIGGPDALQIPAYEELVTAGGISRIGSWFTTVTIPDLRRVTPLLDMLNVRALVARSDGSLPDLVDVPLVRQDRLRVGRRDTAWPRAFFVDGVSTYTDTADLIRQATARGKPFAAIQSNDLRAVELTRSLAPPSENFSAASGYKLTVNTTSFVVHATGTGVAVLGETFLPDDFRATLNGERVPYFRINHAFKAVRIPSAGDWIVKFEYLPVHWRLSLVMAGAGILLLTAFALSAR